jgi:RNA polymerase sigma-70 factor (ECF subfamily)
MNAWVSTDSQNRNAKLAPVQDASDLGSPELSNKKTTHDLLQTVERYLYARTHNSDLAADLSQTVFARIQRNPPPTDVELAPWALGIARNVWKEETRRQRRWFRNKRLAGWLVGSGPADVEQTLMTNNRVRAFKELLNQLPDRFAEVLIFKYVSELPEDEIAKILKVSIATVRSRAHRAKALLEKQAKRLRDDY